MTHEIFKAKQNRQDVYPAGFVLILFPATASRLEQYS